MPHEHLSAPLRCLFQLYVVTLSLQNTASSHAFPHWTPDSSLSVSVLTFPLDTSLSSRQSNRACLMHPCVCVCVYVCVCLCMCMEHTLGPHHWAESGIPRASVTWPSCRFFTSWASHRLVVVSSFSTWANVLSFSWSGRHCRRASLALLQGGMAP